MREKNLVYIIIFFLFFKEKRIRKIRYPFFIFYEEKTETKIIKNIMNPVRIDFHHLIPPDVSEINQTIVSLKNKI